MKSLLNKHKILWADRSFAVSIITGFILFIISLFINYSAIKYAAISSRATSADILLDNLPVINTDIIFSEGALVFVIFIALLFFLKPRTIPFALKSVALFIFIRSAFVTMTHLGVIPNAITTDLGSYGYLITGADLFFSGHTGLPFLFALLYWENKYVRGVFMFSSVVAAIAVIFGHLHYTIDVFSAYFITYGIYHIAKRIFKKDCVFFTYDIGTISSTSKI